MKIAILNTFSPFIHGGAEFLEEFLHQKLNSMGHITTVIKVPFCWNPSPKILESMLSARLLRLQNVDKVIALKFPAYLVPHPNKTVWLLHQYRQAYELWGTRYQDIPNTIAGLKLRDMIINSDNHHLNEVNKIFTVSDVVTDRLKKFNNIDSEVLHPPLGDSKQFYCNHFDDYLFYPSRLCHGKRQQLAIDAMKYTTSNVKLVIAGKPDSPRDLQFLQKKINDEGLTDKVTLIAEHISDQKKSDLMANSLACVFIPYEEDYGYVTLEAYYSKKAVITCTDSGGVLGFVKNLENGFITPPDPEQLAQAFDQLYLNKKMSKEFGECGYELLKQKNISWENTIRKLLQ